MNTSEDPKLVVPRQRFDPGLLVVRRSGDVVYDGTIVGYVGGEPRNWWYSLPHAGPAEGGWHSKREAAEMCVRRAGVLESGCDVISE